MNFRDGRKKRGERFGDLTIVEHICDTWFACRCKCGRITEARYEELRQGDTRSCGCLRRGRPYRISMSLKTRKSWPVRCAEMPGAVELKRRLDELCEDEVAIRRTLQQNAAQRRAMRARIKRRIESCAGA